MTVALSEVYDKSEGKIFQGKIQPVGILLNGNAIIYFKYKLHLKFRNRNISPIIVNFHTCLCKKYNNLNLKFMKNKSYYGERTAHWYIAPSLLFKTLKQHLVYVTSFRLSKSLILEPSFSITLITLVLFFKIF